LFYAQNVIVLNNIVFDMKCLS